MKGREYSRPVVCGTLPYELRHSLASMKGREYSRPVIFSPGVDFAGRLSFNEGAGIFPPGVGVGQRSYLRLCLASMKGREYSRPVECV